MKGTFLEKIIARKRERVAQQKRDTDLAALVERALQERHGRSKHRLTNALADRSRANIIAEFKRTSPSKGVINESVAPATIAGSYERGGAAAISVLTEEDFFGGSLADLKSVRTATGLPILRKDFVVDEFQVIESAAAGADAVLLIAAALTCEELRALHTSVRSFGVDAIVEVHDCDELEIAKQVGAKIIGVNNRNLKTFEVALDVSRELIRHRPADVLMITESGISDTADFRELSTLGYDGFLIGESLMRSGDPAAALRKLDGARIHTRSRMTKVKICGITNIEDALLSVDLGADAIGFNFHRPSPRSISPRVARNIAKNLPTGLMKVGVFVNSEPVTIGELVSLIGLDAVQLHGDEDTEFVTELRSRTDVQIIKAFRVSGGFRPESVLDSQLDGVLLDAYSSDLYGGTGRSFDWAIAGEVKTLVPCLYIAGGLTAENVSDAIAAIQPYAVDVASGVEMAIGKKDPAKLRTFIANAKNA